MKRKLKIKIEQVKGAINMFYVFINGKKVIAKSGSKPREWEGQIASGEVRIKVRVTGIGTASYKLTIDLPGTANDQSFTFQLEGGYHEFEIRI